MFRRALTTAIGAALVSGLALTAPTPVAHADPTWTNSGTISGVTKMPYQLAVETSGSGDAIAAWRAEDDLGIERIRVATATGGVWSAPVTLSTGAADALAPHVGINAGGDAAVAWHYLDAENKNRTALARRLDGGSWSSPAVIGPQGAKPTDIGMDGGGNAVVTYRDGTAVGAAKVLVSGGTTWQSLDAGPTYTASLAVNAKGQALAVWTREEADKKRVVARRLPAVDGPWSAPINVTPAGLVDTYSAAALTPGGVGTVIYGTATVDDKAFLHSRSISAGGAVSVAATLNPAGEDEVYAWDVDESPRGDVAVLLSVGADESRKYAVRAPGGGWSAGSAPTPELTSSNVSISVADTGAVGVGYVTNAGALRTSYRLPGKAWGTFNSGPVGFNSSSGQVAMDTQGNMLLAAVLESPDPALGQAYGSFLDVAGPSTRMTAPGPNTVAGKFTSKWQASDRLSAIESADVRRKTAKWKSGFGATSVVALPSNPGKSVFKASPGQTSCVSVRTMDKVSNVGGWAPYRCTTTPVDDRTLTNVKGFQRVKKAGNYRGTLSVTKHQGAQLALDGVRAKRLALVVDPVAGGGKVAVFFKGKKLGAWSLKGSGAKKVIKVKTFGKVRKGTVVIKVVSPSGKVVRIDGLIAAK